MNYADQEIKNLERKIVKLNDEERAIYEGHLNNLRDRLAKLEGSQSEQKPTAAFDFGDRDESTGEFI